MFDYIKYIPCLYSVNNEHSKQTQSIHLLIEYIMIAIVNNNAVVINNCTSRRANVIAQRTGSDVMGVVKAQMIDALKAKLQNGVAHFLFLKKDGSLREAWGTTANNLIKANVNGRCKGRFLQCASHFSGKTFHIGISDILALFILKVVDGMLHYTLIFLKYTLSQVHAYTFA